MALRRVGAFADRIAVLGALREAGLTLREAHAAVSRLADADHAICLLPDDTDLPALAAVLGRLGVRLGRRRAAGGADIIAAVRTRHGLSQRAFADLLGFDVRTLQNWEQGRNRPDAAAITLVLAYDRAPALIEDMMFEPIA